MRCGRKCKIEVSRRHRVLDLEYLVAFLCVQPQRRGGAEKKNKNVGSRESVSFRAKSRNLVVTLHQKISRLRSK